MRVIVLLVLLVINRDVYASNGPKTENGTDGSDATFTGDVTGDLTGNVTGNVTGDVTGDVTVLNW